MQGSFGSAQFGTTGYEAAAVVTGWPIALLGDPSDHGGSLTSTNQDGTLVVIEGAPTPPSGSGGMTFGSFGFGTTGNATVGSSGTPVCVNGCDHSCPIPGHGTTSVTACTVKSYHNGKLIVTYGAKAGCGATITPPDRRVYVETDGLTPPPSGTSGGHTFGGFGFGE